LTAVRDTRVGHPVARGANDKIKAIIDWKSDVETTTGKLAAYCTQFGEYRDQTCAERALLVLMTSGGLVNV